MCLFCFVFLFTQPVSKVITPIYTLPVLLVVVVLVGAYGVGRGERVSCIIEKMLLTIIAFHGSKDSQ